MEREGLELIPIQVEYICDACKEGIMQYTGEIVSGKGFEHKCPICSVVKPLDYKYPTVRYKRKTILNEVK